MLMAIHFCIDITLRHHRRRLRNKRASLFLRNIGLTRKLMEVRGLRYQKYITAYGFSTPAFFKADSMLGQRRRRWPSVEPALSYYTLQLRILLPEWTLVPDFAWFIWHQIPGMRTSRDRDPGTGSRAWCESLPIGPAVSRSNPGLTRVSSPDHSINHPFCTAL